MTGTLENGSVSELVAPAQVDPGSAKDAANAPTNEPPELSIILVNWNSIRYLMDCLQSIETNLANIDFEIIVVDNASPEGRLELLEERYPLVRVIRSDKNLGFAGANNLGFKRSRGRAILFLNPDTCVVGPAIKLMLDKLGTLHDAGIIGGTLLNTDGTISTTSIQKFPTILNQLLTVEWLRVRFPGLPLWDIAPLFTKNHHHPLKVDVIPGACMMMKREVFERAGMLTEEYFMYAEDIDLNFKVNRLGLSSYYVGDAKIIHHGGCSSSQQPILQWSTVMVQRAMARFFRVSRGPLYAFGYQIAMGLSAIGRLLFLFLAMPFGNKERLQWSITKWTIILKWALGSERIEAIR